MSSRRTDGRLARRWFWLLLLLAVLSMGVLYAGITGGPGGNSAVSILSSSLLLLATTAQAARIRFVLAHADRPATSTGKR